MWPPAPSASGVQASIRAVLSCAVALCFRVFVADPQLVPPGSRQPRSTAKGREELQLQGSRQSNELRLLLAAWRAFGFLDHKNTKAPKALPPKELDGSSKGRVI
jgi:hypothetical protein